MAELTVEQLDGALASGEPYYITKVASTAGSTPRDAGAIMLVGRDIVFGTIGGGSAEWVAIQTVRNFINGADFSKFQTITLGPEIDQCCGGTIDVVYTLLNEKSLTEVSDKLTLGTTTNALIFGAGHTGLALANALRVIGMNVKIVDTRGEYTNRYPDQDIECLALPEIAVRRAKAGTVFVVTTHDHSLDFLITAEALARTDTGYAGMIGSKTKRAVLKSWMGENGYDAKTIDALYCPIGGRGVKNKQPEVIAALCVAEILRAIEPG